MHDIILLILLIVIIAIVIAQIMRVGNHSEKRLLMGIVLGIIGMVAYSKLTNSSSHPIVVNDYTYNLGNACREGMAADSKAEKKEPEPEPKSPFYHDDGLMPHFPTNFDFGQNKFGDMVVPDGWLDVTQDLEVSKNKYDIDGHLINGNTEDPGKSPYDDYSWKLQNNPQTLDAFTAANLHMGRKAREAFYYQSRWGVNSLRPWIEQELNDNANKIWYEDNPDLDQYM
jgi:hypothetical protein